MENQKQEALDVAEQLENGFITLGKTARALRYEAAETIRHLHARVEELEAMLDALGAGGVSAQRVTQGKDHIAQPTQMATTTVVLPEPVGTVGAAPGTSGFTLTVFEAARVPVGTNIYTEQQVRELLATGSQPQADALDAERYLDYLIHNQARVCNNLDEYEGDEDCADCGYWLEFTDSNSQRWVQIGVLKTPRDAIDAAIAAAKEHK